LKGNFIRTNTPFPKDLIKRKEQFILKQKTGLPILTTPNSTEPLLESE
jgi:hypothetical protein